MTSNLWMQKRQSNTDANSNSLLVDIKSKCLRELERHDKDGGAFGGISGQTERIWEVRFQAEQLKESSIKHADMVLCLFLGEANPLVTTCLAAMRCSSYVWGKSRFFWVKLWEEPDDSPWPFINAKMEEASGLRLAHRSTAKCHGTLMSSWQIQTFEIIWIWIWHLNLNISESECTCHSKAHNSENAHRSADFDSVQGAGSFSSTWAKTEEARTPQR